MKNVMLIGEKYSSNLGDGIICDTVNDLLKSKNYNIITMDISGRVSYESDLNSFSLTKEYKVYIKSLVKKVLSFFGYNRMGKNLFKIFSDFKKQFDNLVNNNKFDYIVFAGGQMFIDTFINQINYICKYCEKKNIGIIFNCCGAGNILNKEVLSSILNSKAVKYISLRDGYDKLINYTNKKINLSCDNAVYCFKTYGLYKTDNKFSGVGIMFSTLQSPLRQVLFWKKIVKELIKEKIDFKLFTNGSYKDYCFAQYILNSMNLDINQYLLTQPKEPNQLIEQITSFNRILSMRLHSMIVAYSYNIPAVAICWDSKVNAFFSKIGLNNNCYTLNSNPHEIIEHFKKLNDRTINQLIKSQLLAEVDNNIKTIKKIMED